LTEASDGEEEKSQEGSEEKEEVGRRSRKETRQTAGRKRGRETQGWEIGRESCGETGSAKTDTAVRVPSVTVAPGAGPAPNPAAAWSFP